MIVDIKVQNFSFFVILNLFDMFFFVASTEMIRMEATKAITPPSLEGIDRRITYANRKYHSG